MIAYGNISSSGLAKCSCFANYKLKFHMKQLSSITCPNMPLWTPSKKLNNVVMLMESPIAHSLSSTLGSSMHFEMQEIGENTKRLVGLLVEVQLHWP